MMPIIDPDPLINPTWAPAVDAAGREHPRLVRITWNVTLSQPGGVQIYVDGELVDVVHGVDARRRVLGLDRSESRVIDLLAVTTGDLWTDYSSMLDGGGGGG